MKVTDEMVGRFLAWRLPADFGPDAGISFDPTRLRPDKMDWPTGTNLLNATQAREMLEHVLATVRKAGVVVDSSQLSIFERLLKQAGFQYENAGKVTDDTLLLQVFTEDLHRLGEVIKQANAEAAQARSNTTGNIQ